MSLTYRDKTSAFFTTPSGCGFNNDDYEIEVTRDGIEIDGNTIDWAWIDEARKKVNHV